MFDVVYDVIYDVIYDVVFDVVFNLLIKDSFPFNFKKPHRLHQTDQSLQVTTAKKERAKTRPNHFTNQKIFNLVLDCTLLTGHFQN
jgi:hypothetical protein